MIYAKKVQCAVIIVVVVVIDIDCQSVNSFWEITIVLNETDMYTLRSTVSKCVVLREQPRFLFLGNHSLARIIIIDFINNKLY